MKLLEPRRRIVRRGLPAVALGVVMAGCGDSADSPVTLPIESSVTITGRVATENGNPIVGAEVVLMPVDLTRATDGAGTFRFTVEGAGGPASQYVLEVRSDGYQPVTVQLVVGVDGRAAVEVTMELEPVEPDPDPAPPTGIVVTTFSEDEVACIAPGVELSYTVFVANEGAAPVDAVVLHDTLDTHFERALTEPDIVVDRASFPDAVVVLNPDGRSFHVELGTVSILELTEVYTVTLPARDAGVLCNRVSAVGESGTLLSSHIGCVTDLLVIEIDLVNEDGAMAGGQFSAEPEVFHVGDGGPDRPDALVYRVVVANHHCGSLGFPMGESSLKSILGPGSGAVEFRGVLPGYPSHGVLASSDAGGFVWSIGTLQPGEEAEIRFRAEAVQAGEDVHRIELTVPQLTGTLVHEEPITILP